MKLVETNTGTTHKASEKTGRPICASRRNNLFDDFVALFPKDGKESDIDCKRCLAKIKKYKNSPERLMLELIKAYSVITDSHRLENIPLWGNDGKVREIKDRMKEITSIIGPVCDNCCSQNLEAKGDELVCKDCNHRMY